MGGASLIQPVPPNVQQQRIDGEIGFECGSNEEHSAGIALPGRLPAGLVQQDESPMRKFQVVIEDFAIHCDGMLGKPQRCRNIVDGDLGPNPIGDTRLCDGVDDDWPVVLSGAHGFHSARLGGRCPSSGWPRRSMPPMSLLLSFAASVMWGTADFFGGLLARRRSAVAVVLVMQWFGLAAVLLWAQLTNAWAFGNFLWLGVVAGLTGSAGLMTFYRALAIGRMGIVAPIASMGVLVPLIYGLVRGDEPSLWQWAGILAAIVGVMAASGPELSGKVSPTPVLLAVVTALFFGVAMSFMAAGAASSPTMTIVAMRVVQTAVGLVVFASWRGFGGMTRVDLPLAALVGALDVGANVAYQFATVYGRLTIVSVLSSFAPVATLILGRTILRERLEPVQYVGVAVAITGAVLVSAG